MRAGSQEEVNTRESRTKDVDERTGLRRYRRERRKSASTVDDDSVGGGDGGDRQDGAKREGGRAIDYARALGERASGIDERLVGGSGRTAAASVLKGGDGRRSSVTACVESLAVGRQSLYLPFSRSRARAGFYPRRPSSSASPPPFVVPPPPGDVEEEEDDACRARR